jgi:hypothetical protein
MATEIPARRFAPFMLALALALGACSSSSSPGGPTGGPVAGALDDHCGSGTTMTIQTVGVCYTDAPPTNASSCTDITFQSGGPPDAGAPADDGGTGTTDYGPTLFNAMGFDDDCKYSVSWTATPIRVNTDVTFSVTVKRLDDMTPAHCAGLYAEGYIDNTPAAGPATPGPEEGMTGVYKIGPYKFSVPGIWTVRFHIHGECDDSRSDSPHGHAAFFVNIPDPNHPDAAAATD